MAFRIFLKLKNKAAPHLYVDELKKLMANDKTLHPQMKNTLLLMKKTRMPFIRLAEVKEMVFVPEQYMHFERALEPQILGWVKVNWSDEEIEDFKKDSKKYIKNVLEMFIKMGYDFYDKIDVEEKEINDLIEMTTKK